MQEKHAGHTPGPWVVVHGSSIQAKWDSGEEVQVASMARTSWSNAGGGREKNIRLHEESEANARLISAAPRMYAYVAARAASGDADAALILGEIDEHS